MALLADGPEDGREITRLRSPTGFPVAFKHKNKRTVNLNNTMNAWLTKYQEAQKSVIDNIPLESVGAIIGLLQQVIKNNGRVFVFGNGGSSANASHFATDLGKGASDKLNRRFQVLSLNDNVGWMTAISNDYGYEDVFWRQLENFGKPGDLVIALSVSGNSPNCVKALEWVKKNGLISVALVGAQRGRIAEIADHTLVIHDNHYGRVEDAHMIICHMLCYSFMENPQLGSSSSP
jgi:D-sedoheptulose 7-phosphate isomerase